MNKKTEKEIQKLLHVIKLKGQCGVTTLPKTLIEDGKCISFCKIYKENKEIVGDGCGNCKSKERNNLHLKLAEKELSCYDPIDIFEVQIIDCE